MNWLYKSANQKQPWEMTQAEFSTSEIPLIYDEQKFPQIKYVRSLLMENGINVEHIGITGSHAAGVATSNSDVDVYVRVPDAQFHRADDIVASLSQQGIDVLLNWRGTGMQGGTLRGTKTHKRLVARALAEGLPVPMKVLKDYPDLL